ncbi:capsule assembly Wzi family protein [Alishewanella longhuensis]
MAGNWVLSVSQQQQWWGAIFKDTSFSPSLFSHPARVVQLNRFEQSSSSTLPFSQKPWQLQVQYGELTGDALFPNRRFSSARVTAKPTNKLELSVDWIKWQAQPDSFFNEQPYSVVSSSDKALDFKFALTGQSSLYGRAGNGDNNDFWMLGKSYYFGNQRYMWNLYAEFQQNDRKSYLNQLQPQLLEPELLIKFYRQRTRCNRRYLTNAPW